MSFICGFYQFKFYIFSLDEKFVLTLVHLDCGEREHTCGSSKPLCIGTGNGDEKTGICGKEIDPKDPVVFWEHDKSGWKVEMMGGDIANMANSGRSTANMSGLSTIQIPEYMSVILYDQTDFNGNRYELNGPQTVKLWTQKYGGVNYNDNVKSLTVRPDGRHFKTTYINEPNNKITQKDDNRLKAMNLQIEDTLDMHYQDGQKKKMRFIELKAKGDAGANNRYFDRFDFNNMQLYLGNSGITFCMWFKMKTFNQNKSKYVNHHFPKKATSAA